MLVASPLAFAQGDAAPTTENSLQIILAGVEASEDAPFASLNYQFLPGDAVYFQFQVSGYAVKTTGNEQAEVRKIALSYEATAQDEKGVPLAPPSTGSIEEELHSEDKNWTPKRRGSFPLPSFAPAGTYRIHLVLKDALAQKSIERDLPFRMGGTVVAPSASLSVQDFQFLRKEDDAEGLDIPAFSPGDTIFMRFLITGFQLGPNHEYHLSYGVVVNRPDGKVFLNTPVAAEIKEKSFYPASFVPGTLGVSTTRTTSPRGTYSVTVTLRDASNGQTYQLKRAFTVE